MHIRPGPPKICHCKNKNVLDSYWATSNKVKNIKQHKIVTAPVSRRLGCMNNLLISRTVFTKYRNVNNVGRYHSNNAYNYNSGHLVIRNF